MFKSAVAAMVIAPVLAMLDADTGLAHCGQTGEYQMTAGEAIGAEEIGQMGLDEMTKRFGPPLTEVFQLSSDVSEFRIELLNYFDQTRLAENPPQITEATWQVSPEQNLTVWYVETGDGLVYQHHLKWSAGQEF